MSIGPFDWNGDGKRDLFDIFMDIEIMEEDDDTSKSDDTSIKDDSF